MTAIQDWARNGIPDIPPDKAKCQIPLCRGCQFGAAKHRSHKQDKSSLSYNAKVPGNFECINQMVAGTPGLIPSSSGNVAKSKCCHTCATVWCDHVSRFLWSHLQESTNAVTTLQSKVEFEAFAQRYGHSIKHIHSDNQIFDSKAFTKAVELADQ
jgi:hypothetical protein